jgi:hypothetical protein
MDQHIKLEEYNRTMVIHITNPLSLKTQMEPNNYVVDCGIQLATHTKTKDYNHQMQSYLHAFCPNSLFIIETLCVIGLQSLRMRF